MRITVKQIAELVDGKIFGNKALKLKGISDIKRADKTAPSFIHLPAYEHFLTAKSY